MVLAAVAGLALFVYFFRLGVPSWRGDEIVYRDAGQDYLSGDFTKNLEASLLAKYVLGAAKDLFGSGPVAVRAPTAVAGLLTGVLLALAAGRIGGWWAAVLALALWCFLPRPSIIGEIDVEQIKIERYARLDVYMGLFIAAALLAAWRWIETGRWRWALAAGASVGLAAACKQPGAVVLPAVLAAGLAALGLTRRTMLQASALVGVGALVFAVSYLPLVLAGEASSAIEKMQDSLDYQPLVGHPFVLEGTYYHVAPWWGNAWWQWKSLGTPATAAVVVCLLLAPFVLRRSVALLLVGSIALLFAVLSFWLDFSVPHYYYAWQPPLILTCALVLCTLARRGRMALAAAVVIALPLAVAAVGNVRDVARIAPRDYAALEDELGGVLRRGTVVSASLTEMSAHFPGLRMAYDPVGVEDLSAVIDDPTANRRRDSTITAFVRTYRSRLILRRVDFLRIYLTRSPAEARRLAEISRAARDEPPPTPTGRRAARVKRCLEEAGLTPRITQGSDSGVAMNARLSGGNQAVVVVQPTRRAAVRSTRKLRELLRGGGGIVDSRGSVVVGYVRRPGGAEARLVESCSYGRPGS